MLPATRHARRGSPPTLFVSALLAAIFAFAVTSVAVPGEVLGASHPKVALCSANLRTSASVSSRVRAVIKTGTKVSAVTRVTGRHWSTSCAGKSVSGSSWFRISAVNGKSVKSLYGVTYLYAATGLFKAYVPPPATRYAACSVNLRTGPSQATAVRKIISLDTRVASDATVTGTAWDTTCAGNHVSGNTWYRITAVGDKSVSSLLGVTYVYAAAGLFKTAPTPRRRRCRHRPRPPTPHTDPPPAPQTRTRPRPQPDPDPHADPGRDPPTPPPAAFLNMTEGIDISHWQGTINWTNVAAAGKRFAYMKASESTDYVDPTYTSNRAQARAAGLRVGAYHFAQPSTTAGDAVAEADHFLATAALARGDMLPVLDLERSGGLSQPALTAWVQAYMGRILQQTGLHAVIYCSPSFWKNYLGDTAWFAANGYEVLWIAHWTTAIAPSVPGSAWDSNGWTFWQYTSDGVVPGISGRVDLNRFNGKDMSRVLIP